MVDPVHGDAPDAPPSGPGADRDVKIEQLLLAGLDHYFKGQYERAIDIWTRVLFFDRGHARARAYIERARASLAERLRESEELMHTGVEAFQRGNVGEARELLETAVARGGPRDEALAVLDRLSRLETAAGHTPRLDPTVPRNRRLSERRDVDPSSGGHGRLAWAVSGLLMVSIVAATALLVGGYQPGFLTPPADAVVERRGVARDPLPTPRSAELVLSRGQRLFEEGRLYEALRLLDVIGPGDALRGEADRLRAQIQQALLASIEAGRTPEPPSRP